MQAYRYHPGSGEYVGTIRRDLLPEFGATDVPPPPRGPDQSAVWTGLEWALITDMRGTWYWLPGDAPGSPARIWDQYGPLPEEAITTPPPPRGPDQSAVWTGLEWALITDMRGTWYWLPGDAPGSPARIWDQYGPLPEEAITTPPPPSPEVWAALVRTERDRRLTATDRYALPDYPHQDEAARQAWMDYRQALRDMPQAEGFPWGGVGDAPWPEEPEA